MELSQLEEAIGEFRTLLIAGDMDTGKSFLVQSLLRSCQSRGERVVHLDLDMGQSTIGPPTTIGLVAPDGRQYLYFVGNITPYGIIRDIEHGVRRFRELMNSTPHDRVVTDTPGLVQGDFAWSLLRMELRRTQTDFVVLLDRNGETRRIADGLIKLRVPFQTFGPSLHIKKKSYTRRSAYRMKLFLDYFKDASIAKIPLSGKRIIHLGSAEEKGRLVGLLNSSGFLVSLGIVMEADEEGLVVAAPASELHSVTIIKFGLYSIDPNGQI